MKKPYLISFTGAQSTGKTTLLNHLIMNNDCTSIEFVPEVTRRIKRELDVPINLEGTSITQYLILNDHIVNVYKKTPGVELKILDRCILDGLVYTDHLFFKGLVSEAAYKAAVDIYNNLCSHYDIVFYTDPADVDLVDDGERSVDLEFRKQIINAFESYISESCFKIVKLSGTVKERLQTIKEHLDKLDTKYRIKI